MIDFKTVGKWIQRFVKDAGFDELSFEMEQTMVNEVMQAAFGDEPLYVVDVEKYDRYGQQFNPVERLKTLGVLVQMWPIKESDEGS